MANIWAGNGGDTLFKNLNLTRTDISDSAIPVREERFEDFPFQFAVGLFLLFGSAFVMLDDIITDAYHLTDTQHVAPRSPVL